MVLLEVETPKIRILNEEIDERTGERALRVEVKWQQSGIINGNNRRYRAEILRREVERLRPQIEKKAIFGCAYHPERAEVPDVSHIWESVTELKDGQWMGVVKVLPTTRGKDVQVIIRNGGVIGMSSRGTGTVTMKEETINGKKVKFEDVNDDFKLRSPGDFVLSPSVTDAGVRRMMEQQADKDEPSLEEFSSETTKVSDEEREHRLRFRYGCAQVAGFTGDFETYKAVVVDSDTKEKKEINERYIRALRAGYQGSQSEFFELIEKGEL